VLADALAYACEQEPDLLLDFATLTGAARIAMGPDLPPVFSNDRELAKDLVASGDTVEDPLWELPLYAPYRSMIDSDIADISNSGKSSYGGCITAALFLQEFVTAATPWAHFDTFAWNQTSRPGRPAGGEALGLRAAWAYLKERYA
jgi:leucyl aminopeptidase